jgi:2-hydroxychromene-2-carboxylate isomerase
MARVEFLFDFGSPNAYLAHRVIPDIERRTGAKFDYVPVLLGGIFKLTGNKSPMEAFAGIRNKLEYEQLETRRFIARHRIAGFRFNPFFPVNTLALMRGAVAAQFACVAPRYVEAMFHHMWEAPKKLDDPTVIRAVLEDSGLDAQALLDAAATPQVKQRLLENTENAVARGVFGIPSFFVGDELFFGGRSRPYCRGRVVIVRPEFSKSIPFRHAPAVHHREVEERPMLSPRIAFAVLLSAGALSPRLASAAAPQPDILGVFKNWAAYSTGSGDTKVCFALSRPVQTEPRKIKRDSAYFLINDWPGRKARAEPEIVPGFQYKDGSSVTADAGADKFTLFTRNDGGVGGAWVQAVADEARLIDAMKSASQTTISGMSKRGTVVRDTYATAGLADALEKIHQTCGL